MLICFVIGTKLMHPVDETLSGCRLEAELILHNLTREQWATHCDGLRDYVRWLLAKKGRHNKLTEFEERLAKSDAALDAKVAAGEMSEAEAAQTKGDRIWWRAFEETRNGALYIAMGEVIESNLTAYFSNEPVKAVEDLDKIQTETEHVLATKLRECLGLDGG